MDNGTESKYLKNAPSVFSTHLRTWVMVDRGQSGWFARCEVFNVHARGASLPEVLRNLADAVENSEPAIAGRKAAQQLIKALT
jgi:hypothetical protein